mgnify:CR=1 FL=1
MSTGDRNNYSGEFSFTAPTGGVTKGKLYQVGSGLIVVARQTVDAGATYTGATEGRLTVTKTAGTGITFVVGSKVYFDSNTATVTDVATSNTHCGYALAAAAAADTTADILLIQPV